MFCLESQTDTDDFEGICEEDGSDASHGAADEAAPRRLLVLPANDEGAYLFIGKELDAGVGEYSDQRRRVPSEQPGEAFVGADVLHCRHNAEPRARILCELRVARLEEDLDSIERCDNRFCCTARQASRDAGPPDVIKGPRLIPRRYRPVIVGGAYGRRPRGHVRLQSHSISLFVWCYLRHGGMFQQR